MAVSFRNVDASPDDPVDTWPYEALVTVLERGLVPDWQPVFAEIRRRPWGSVARRVETYVADQRPDGVGTLFALALQRARVHAEQRERAEVAARVRAAIERSGLTAAKFATAIGTSAARMSTYANGKVIPSAALFLRIEQMGDGEPERRDVRRPYRG